MMKSRGFTLIELAIVLVIITTLVGGLAVPLSAQIQARRIAETRKIMEEAREAIIGYAMSHRTNATCKCTYSANPILGNPPIVTANPTTCMSFCPVAAAGDDVEKILTVSTGHHLPCPDLMQNDPEVEDNDDDKSPRDLNNGREDRYIAGPKAGECATDSGNYPWVTLGTASQDAWGNRLRYAVTAEFANKNTGFSSTDSGTLQICSTSGCATADVAKDVVAVLVSYGPNGWGARSIHDKMLKDPTSDDEKENANTSSTFVSRAPTKADSTSGEFDDLVVWISADQLRGRICPAGGCP